MAGIDAPSRNIARILFLSLSMAAFPHAAAQEAPVSAAVTPSLPTIAAAMLPYSIPGKADSSGREMPRLIMDMRLDIRGIEDPIRDIDSAKVYWSAYDDAYFWTVEPESFKKREDGSYRSAKAYSDSALSSVSEAVLPLGPFRVEVSLASGSVLQSFVRIASPGETAPGDAEFLYASSYRDIVTPWHVRALAVPQIAKASLAGDTFTLEFSIDDDRVANADVFFCRSDDRVLVKTTKLVDNASGEARSFLNGGKPLRTDGRANVVSLSLASFAFPAGSGRDDIAKVYVAVYDGLKFRGGDTPGEYRHYAISRKAAAGRPAAPVPAAIGASTESRDSSAPVIPRPRAVESDDAYYRWLVGLSGIPSRIATLPATELFPLPLTEARVEKAVKALRSSREVLDLADLDERISECLGSGRGDLWSRHVAAIEASPGLGESELLGLSGNADLSAFRLGLVRRYGDEPWERGLRAWDLGNAAMLVRWGFAAGILDARGAWERLARIGNEAVALYDSWNDFGKDFIAGLLFDGAGAEEVLSRFREAQRAYVALLAEDGEWRGIPWSTGRERGR